MFIRIVELVLLFLILAGLISQVLVPALMGRRLFPWFSKQARLENELAEALQAQHEAKLAAEVKAVKQQTRSKTK